MNRVKFGNTKRVWVLEKWVSKEWLEETIADIRSSAEGITDEATLTAIDETASVFERSLKKFPLGHWVGCEGKENLNAFIICARRTIIDDNEVNKFRVVEAVIAENAKTWLGYESLKMNDEILDRLQIAL